MRRIAAGAAAAWLAAGAAGAADLIERRVYDAARVRGAFLGRGGGARGAAMGGAFTGLADGAAGASWNPGGLGQIGALSVFAQHEAADDDRGLSGLAAAVPIGDLTAAFAVSAQSYGELLRRDANGDPTGTESPVDVAVTHAWAGPNPGPLGGWTGLAVEMVQEAGGAALLGCSAGGLVPLTGALTAGWAVLHAGPASRGGRLPGAFRSGASWGRGPLTVTADLGYGLTDRLLGWGAGTEVRLPGGVAARAGWRGEGRSQIAGSGGFTAGLGFARGPLAIDYAFAPYGDLAITHRVSLEYRAPGGARSRRLPVTRASAPATAPAEPAAAKPAPQRRREPTIKTMPATMEHEEPAQPLKSAPAKPVPPAKPPAPAPSATAMGSSGGPSPDIEPPAEAGSSATPAVDPLLAPPAELEPAGGEVEGLRGRRGGGRPGEPALTDSLDAPLKGGR